MKIIEEIIWNYDKLLAMEHRTGGEIQIVERNLGTMAEWEGYGHSGILGLVTLDLDSMNFNTIKTTHTIILSW